MHSSPTITTPTVPFLVQAGFCATGLVLGLLTYHTFPQPNSARAATADEKRPALAAPFVRPSTLTRPALPPTATAATSANDPAGATAALQEILESRRSEVHRGMKIASWVDRATEAELKAALEQPPLAEAPFGSEFIDCILLGRLAEIDGEAALQFVGKLERETDRTFDQEAISALFESWVSWDPQGASRGALSLLQSNPGRYATVAQTLVANLSREFPLYARDLASQLARSDDEAIREAGYEAHADLLRQHLGRGNDYASATAWITTTQVSADERQFLLGALVAEGLGNDHNADALQAFRQMDASSHPDLTLRVIRGLAESDPQASREIASALPAGALREEATSALTRLLLKSESPEKVFTWLGAQSTHADFDGAFAQLAEAFDGKDPRSAWSCASRVSSETERQPNLTYEFGFKWLKADFAQASRELPADLVQKYQRSTVLLREFSAVFPDSTEEFSVSFRSSKPHVH